MRDGLLTAPEMPVFLPVQVYDPPLSPAGPLRLEQPLVSAPAPAPATSRIPAGLIEIELGGGRQVRVGSDVNLAALRRVLAALRG